MTLLGLRSTDRLSTYRVDQLNWITPVIKHVAVANDKCQQCRRLSSSDVFTCVVARTQTGFRVRAFQVAGPNVWNCLPASLLQSDTTIFKFKRLLKTHLFAWDCGALVSFVFNCAVYKIYYIRTYILTRNKLTPLPTATLIISGDSRICRLGGQWGGHV